MIREFLDSWDLFHNSYFEGWLIGLLLAMIGVLVVARDQIFIGAAVSQASTVGIALALLVGGMVHLETDPALHEHGASWIHSDSFKAVMAVAFSVIAALVTARGGRAKMDSHEAITGWIFLLSSALSVLILAHSPHGLEEIHRVHSSSIIGATALDVWVFAAFVLMTALTVGALHQRLLLCSLDPSMAAAVGMNVPLWSIGFSVWLGMAVGLSIRASGLLYTFGMLVLPALVAKNICREVRPMFWVSPLIALVTSGIGFVLANHYDSPPAQMTVALLGLLLVAVWLFRGFCKVASQV